MLFFSMAMNGFMRQRSYAFMTIPIFLSQFMSLKIFYRAYFIFSQAKYSLHWTCFPHLRTSLSPFNVPHGYSHFLSFDFVVTSAQFLSMLLSLLAYALLFIFLYNKFYKDFLVYTALPDKLNGLSPSGLTVGPILAEMAGKSWQKWQLRQKRQVPGDAGMMVPTWLKQTHLYFFIGWEV